jgi:hypothetical protein
VKDMCYESSCFLPYGSSATTYLERPIMRTDLLNCYSMSFLSLTLWLLSSLSDACYR